MFLNCILKGRYIYKKINLRSITFLYSEVDVLEVSESTLDIFDFKFSNSLGVSISDTSFNQWISLREGSIKNSIRLTKIKAKGQIGITDISSKSLTVNECSSNLNFYNGSYDAVRFYNNNFQTAKIFSLNNKPLSVSSLIIIEQDDDNFKYGKLELGPDFNSSLLLRGKNTVNFAIDELEIKDSMFSNVQINIDQIDVSSVKFSKLINSASFNIFNLISTSKNSVFEIENSFLGPTKIYNCNLNQFKVFKFKLSDIRDISYNNVIWPDNLSKENPKERAELYKQLKHVANKNNDSINNVRFYSNEKSAFYKNLSWSWSDTGTKLIFFFNKISNNFNLSWIQPIILNVVLQFLIYILIILTINSYNNWGGFISSISPIFKFLIMINPVFKAEEIQDGIFNFNIAIVLVTLSRIISAYLIYQTVAAYRRHN